MEQRFKSHNKLAKKGWTVKYRPWQIIYTESFLQKKDAQKREKQLKSAKGRKWIWSLIEKKIGEGLISA